MTLRIMLVGLVASLGFDLPSGTDVASWAEAGTAWVRARMDDRSGTEVEVKFGLAGPSDCQQAGESFKVPAPAGEASADADTVFAAVSEKVVSDLSADLLTSQREEAPGVEASPIVAITEPASVGLPEGEELGCLVFSTTDASAVEAELAQTVVPADEVESVVEPPSRSDQVSSAVRLTREAVQAWAALMQQPDEECHPTR